MARYSRRRARTRRAYRKKSRKTRRRTRVPKRFRSKSSLNMHTFVRSCEANLSNFQANPDSAIAPCVSSDGTIIGTPTSIGISSPYGTSGGFATNMTFQLNSTAGYTDFSTLYDQYKIQKVKIYFEYSGTSGGDVRSDGNPMPKLVVFPDYDDGVYPSFGELMQREAVTRRVTLDRPRVFTHYPKLKNYIESTPGTSAAAATYKTAWIDVAQDAIKHYGVKLALLDWPIYNYVPGATSAQYMARPILRIRVEYYLKFRNVR